MSDEPNIGLTDQERVELLAQLSFEDEGPRGTIIGAEDFAALARVIVNVQKLMGSWPPDMSNLPQPRGGELATEYVKRFFAEIQRRLD